jgi:hypothetical protein
MKPKLKPKPREEVPSGFRQWWEPWGVDKDSGASVGGHPDAYRVWARKDPGRWRRRHYGVLTPIAWITALYRDEYERWVDAGRPERENFISLAASLERQKQFWRDLKPIIERIGKPMPEVQLPEEDALPF